MIRCLLVDDQDLVRSGFALIVGLQTDMTVVGELDDGDGVVDFCRENPIDVILMDIRMKRMNGLQTIRAVAQAEGLAASPRIIALTTFDIDEYALEAIAAGASDFLLKDARAEELTHAIRAVFDGDAVLAPSTTRRMLSRLVPGNGGTSGVDSVDDAEAARLASLSPREREVFDLITDGQSNREIAAELFLSEATVKTHINRILSKLEARDRIQLVVLGQRARPRTAT